MPTLPRPSGYLTVPGAGPAPEGWPADLPPPEQPAGADAKDADEAAEAVGAYAAAALVSPAWQLREAGALWLERCLLPGVRAGPSALGARFQRLT